MTAVGEQTYLTDLTTSPGRIGCRLTQGTAQTGWTLGTYNTITFGTEDFDWGDIFDTATSTSKIFIGRYLGLWQLSGLYAAAVPGTSTSNHRARITVNGAAVLGGLSSDTPASSTSVLPAMVPPPIYVVSTLSTDYAEIQGFTQGSGTPVGTQVNGEARCMFQALFIGTQ